MTIKDEAIKYFIFFSKFEYALKNAGYFKNKFNAHPDWDKYINSLNELNLEDIEFISNDAKYLINSPPKRQIIKDDELDWEDATVNNLKEAIYACTRVRNNLFHGGKCSDAALKRNKELLQGSMDILEKTLNYNSKVKVKFDDAQI